jgi:hypothetical protein
LRTAATFGALAFACAALAGCASQSPALESELLYEATLAGAQEVPPVATAASGRAELRYESRSSMLQWRVTHTGLSGPVTAAHFHGPAGPGQNAPAVVPLNAAGPAITGQLRITPEQFTQLNSGHWYVNLHTAAHPQGEIRGQLRHRPD